MLQAPRQLLHSRRLLLGLAHVFRQFLRICLLGRLGCRRLGRICRDDHLGDQGFDILQPALGEIMFLLRLAQVFFGIPDLSIVALDRKSVV